MPEVRQGCLTACIPLVCKGLSGTFAWGRLTKPYKQVGQALQVGCPCPMPMLGTKPHRPKSQQTHLCCPSCVQGAEPHGDLRTHTYTHTHAQSPGLQSPGWWQLLLSSKWLCSCWLCLELPQGSPSATSQQTALPSPSPLRVLTLTRIP